MISRRTSHATAPARGLTNPPLWVMLIRSSPSPTFCGCVPLWLAQVLDDRGTPLPGGKPKRDDFVASIYVGNLAFGVTEDELQAAFEEHGQVSSVNIIKDRETGRSRLRFCRDARWPGSQAGHRSLESDRDRRPERHRQRGSTQGKPIARRRWRRRTRPSLVVVRMAPGRVSRLSLPQREQTECTSATSVRQT